MAGIYAPKTTTDPVTKKRTTTPGHPSKMRTTLCMKITIYVADECRPADRLSRAVRD